MNIDNRGEESKLKGAGRVAGLERTMPPAFPIERNIEDKGQLFGSFADEYAGGKVVSGPFAVVEHLLRTPARIAHSVVEERSIRVLLWLLLSVLGGYLAYGLVMASFSGGMQFCFVPLKILWGVVLSVAICFPSLYIFSSLAGSRLDLFQTLGLVMMALALSAIMLLGFAPITWVFSQSTGTLYFMGLLHLCVWGLSVWFGYRLLQRAMGHINGKRMGILKIWACIFIVVALQMTANLRPLVGPHKADAVKGKKFFISHWSDMSR